MRLSQGGRGFDATIEDVNRQLCGLVLLTALAASGCADSTAVTAPTAVALASIVLSSSTVSGGTPVTGVLTLTVAAPTGGAVVTLVSSSAAAVVPASVTIPAGSNTFSFPITTTAVAASTTITATYATASQAATLTTTVVTAAALQSVFLSTGVSIAGVPVQGTITLTSPAPSGGLTVALASSSPLATVPATVVIPSGDTFQTFPIDIGASLTTSATTITATYAGVARTAALTIGQFALSIGPTSVPGGLPITGTVSLPTPAPDSGALVSLVSSSPDAIVPASVMIPAGAASQTFTISTFNAPPTRLATITASYGGSSQSAAVTVVAYASVVAVSCATTTPAAGATVSCTGTLDGPSPAGGWLLALATSDASVSAPPRVTVPASSQTFQFSLAIGPVTAATAVVVNITDAASGLSLWNIGLSVSP
jgi:hypothetical protein